MSNNEMPNFLYNETLKNTSNKNETEKNLKNNPLENERNEEKREIIDWAKKLVSFWHDQVNPDYIFLTASGAVAPGYLLKETWKSAYFNEKQPTFYTFDPGANKMMFKFMKGEEKQSQQIKFIKKRITKESPVVIIYDEGGGPQSEVNFAEIDPLLGTENHSWAPNDLDRTTAGDAGEQLTRMMNRSDVHPSRVLVTRGMTAQLGAFNSATNHPIGESRPSSRLFGVTDRSSNRPRTPDEALITDEYLKDLAEKDLFTYTGRAVKHPEQRKNAIEWIKQIKKVGAEAGEELRNEIEIKNSQE